MKHTFHYGNIFIGTKIEDAEILSDVLGLREGEDYDPIGIGSLISPKKKAIEEFLGGKISLSLIDYPAGYQYLDVFLLGDDFEAKTQEDSEYKQDIGLPDNLREKWDKYLEAKSAAVLGGIVVEQDGESGHWISDYAPLRQTEEQFLEDVHLCFEEVIRVLQHSSNPDQRIAAAYLLQWQPDKELAVNLLLEALAEDPSTGVHNEATRALLALTNKVKIPSEKVQLVLDLIFDTSSLSMNKGLSLIAKLVSDGLLSVEIGSRYIERIKALAEVKQPCVANSAQDALRALGV